MNLVYGLALHEFSIAQWVECPPSVWEVIGSNAVWDSGFSLSHACDMLIISSSQKWAYTTGWQNEKDSKTFVGDKRNRPIMCMFCGDVHLTLVFSGLLQRYLLEGKWSLVENISKHNYCLTHKVYHPLLPAVLIHKFFKDGRQVPGIEVKITGSTRWNEKLINLPILHFLFLILLFIIFNSCILWLKNSSNNIIRLYTSWTKVAYLCWFLWEQVSQQ